MAAASLGKMPIDVGATRDLAVDALARICRAQLRPVRGRESHERQQILFGGLQERAELGELIGEAVDERGHAAARLGLIGGVEDLP